MSYPTSTALSISRIELLKLDKYTDVAALTILIWDYGLTLESEISVMWSSNWSIAKVLFFLTRYLPFVDVVLVVYYQFATFISEHECHWSYNTAGWFIISGIIVAEIILVFRTWALWGGTRIMAILLALICVAVAAPVFWIEFAFLTSVEFVTSPQSGSSCIVLSGDPIIAVNFIFVIAFETFVLILTLIKGVQHHRLTNEGGFLYVLCRDGILFYVYLLGFSVINLIVVFTAPRDSAVMLAILQRVLHSCVSSRVLINLREAHVPLLPVPYSSEYESEFGHNLTSVQTQTSEGPL